MHVKSSFAARAFKSAIVPISNEAKKAAERPASSSPWVSAAVVGLSAVFVPNRHETGCSKDNVAGK
jgi:hypothetical protein